MSLYRYAGPSRCTVLTSEEVKSFTNFLILPPNLHPTSTFFHTHQIQELAKEGKIASPIIQAKGILPSLKNSLHLSTSPGTHPCHTHKTLNQHLIYSIIQAFEAEIIAHTRSIYRVMRYHKLPENVHDWLERMQALVSIWASPKEIQRCYPCNQAPLHTRVESGCEACMLALVGGRVDVLFDLRASLVSRRRSGGREPRLLRYVDNWLNACDDAEILMDSSDSLAGEIKKVRRYVREIRKQRHASGGDNDNKQFQVQLKDEGRDESCEVISGEKSRPVTYQDQSPVANAGFHALGVDPRPGEFVNGHADSMRPSYAHSSSGIHSIRRKPVPPPKSAQRYSPICANPAVFKWDDNLEYNEEGAGTKNHVSAYSASIYSDHDDDPSFDFQEEGAGIGAHAGRY